MCGALWLHCGGMSLQRLHSIAIHPAKGTEVNTAHLSACQRTGCGKHNEKSPCLLRKINFKKRLILHSSASVVLHCCDRGTRPSGRCGWSKTRRQRYKRNNGLVSIKAFYLYLGEHHIYGDQESSMHCGSRKHLQTARKVVQFLWAVLQTSTNDKRSVSRGTTISEAPTPKTALCYNM